jgi:DNA replication protein DnaC
MNNHLREMATKLRLSGLLSSLEIRLQEAMSHALSHAEFLELVLQDELAVRDDRRLQRRVKAAMFRELKTLEGFNWAFNPMIKKKQIFELATGRFIRESRDVLWLGPPGVGKSHLCQAIGYQVIKSGFAVLYRSIFDVVRDFLHDEALGQEDKVLSRYLKPDLLIIDDMGMKHLPKRSGEYLFEIVMRRHEVRSTMMTSNRPLEDWGKLVGDVPSASAILDRFLQHAEMIQITGRSYRLRDGGRDVKDEAGPSKPTSVPPSPDGSDLDSKPANAPLGSEKGRPGSKPANAPPGSEGSDLDSKPANAPSGSGRGRSSSKPASAPPGSDESEEEEA